MESESDIQQIEKRIAECLHKLEHPRVHCDVLLGKLPMLRF